MCIANVMHHATVINGRHDLATVLDYTFEGHSPSEIAASTMPVVERYPSKDDARRHGHRYDQANVAPTAEHSLLKTLRSLIITASQQETGFIQERGTRRI